MKPLRNLVVTIAFALVCALCSDAFAADKPNIVLILADDLGCGDLGCYGGKMNI